MPENIKPVSVSSLSLPEGTAQKLREIAASEGRTEDLDTVEEFRMAAVVLERLEADMRDVMRRMPFPREVSAPRNPMALVLSENGELYEYRAEFIMKDEGCDGVKEKLALIRENVRTGEVEEIPHEIYGCIAGASSVAKMITDGKDIYLFYTNSQQYGRIGKVVYDEEKGRRVEFIKPWDWPDDRGILPRDKFSFVDLQLEKGVPSVVIQYKVDGKKEIRPIDNMKPRKINADCGNRW